MSINHAPSPSRNSAAILSATSSALALIPPLFPLRSFVAVNPFLGFTDLAFQDAAPRLLALRGRAPLQSADEYRALFAKGEISAEDLDWASDDDWPVSRLREALNATPDSSVDVAWTAVDAAESELAEERWRDFVLEDISKWCGAFYDRNQTTWKMPWASAGLYQAFRDGAVVDQTAPLHGLGTLRDVVAELSARRDR